MTGQFAADHAEDMGDPEYAHAFQVAVSVFDLLHPAARDEDAGSGDSRLWDFVSARIAADGAGADPALTEWADRQQPIVNGHIGCGDECSTLRCYAEIWRGHEDFDQEWRNA